MAVRRSLRNLLPAWFALMLTALAPVLAYGHIHIGAHGEIVEYCAADAADDTDSPDTTPSPHDHSQPHKSSTPHCPYCPGFGAGAALSLQAMPSAVPAPTSWAPAGASHVVPASRSSLRIAQQRAPPSAS